LQNAARAQQRISNTRHEKKMLSKQISWPWFNSQTTWIKCNREHARFWLADHKLSCDSNANRASELHGVGVFSFCPCVLLLVQKKFLSRAHSNHYIIVRATHNDRIMNCIHVINKLAYGWEYGWLTGWVGWLILVSAAFFFLPSISRYLSKFNLRVWPLSGPALFARPKKKPNILAARTCNLRAESDLAQCSLFASGP
jgi:hypothetical protein